MAFHSIECIAKYIMTALHLPACVLQTAAARKAEKRVGGGYHGGCLLAPQTDGLVQQLGHLLVIGMVLPTRPAGNEAIVLQLGHVLAGEALQAPHPKHGGFACNMKES